MAAIAVSSVPRAAVDPVSRGARSFLLPIFLPYLRFTGQWQEWNLFSPDPPRRVTTYAVEKMERGEWQKVSAIDPSALPFSRRSRELKLLRRIEEQEDADRKTLWYRYLRGYCALHPSSALRLVSLRYVMPIHPATLPDWQRAAAHPRISVLHSLHCK